MDDEDRLLELAIELVDEALQSYEHLVSPDQKMVLRAVMVSDLLDTKAGQQLLRSVQADPAVGQSGDVRREDGSEVDPGAGESNTG